jgi:hypothetical protein
MSENKRNLIGFKCDDITRKSLEKIARENEMTLSQVVRRAIRMLIEPPALPPAEPMEQRPEEPAAPVVVEKARCEITECAEPEIDIMDVILKGG